MYHPSRGGVRGGRDQFNWEDVKADKHRENYLGHSVKAPVGRWQKGKDLYWYTKEHGADGPTKEEIKRIQEEEEDAMKEMLGLAPRRKKRPQGSQLQKREVDELLKKGKSGEELASAYVDGERVQGLGFAPAPGQTGGQSGSKRTIEVERNEDVSRQPEKISNGGYVKEVAKPVTQHVLPLSEDRSTSPGFKSRQDVADVSSEDEAADRKKRKEEKRRARELRRETKRARKEAKKALKDGEDREMTSSRHDRPEHKGRRRYERKDTSPDYHRQKRKHGDDKAGYESTGSDSSGEKFVRLSTAQNSRRKVDYDSSSDVEPSKPHVKYRRSGSPEKYRVQRKRRPDADRERKVEESSTSDDSGFDRRHKRERKEDSPIQPQEKRRRHDSDSEGHMEPHSGDRLKREWKEKSPFSLHAKYKRYDADRDGYAKQRRYNQRTKKNREDSSVRGTEKQRRHDSDDERYVNNHKEDQRRKGKDESPVRRYETHGRHDFDSEKLVNSEERRRT